MVSVEKFSSLVSGIYAAAVTPDRWHTSLGQIHTALGGISAALCRPNHAVWTIEDSNLPAAAARSYAAYYSRLDDVMDAVQAGSVGTVRTGAELITPHRTGEFYADWMVPNRLEDGLFVRLTRASEPVCLVVAAPRRTDDFATTERVATLAALVPHLQQAVRIQDRLSLAAERVRHGMLRVTTAMRVAMVNAAAEQILAAGDGLSVRAGRLTAADVRTAAELQSAVAGACAGLVRSAGCLLCSRPSGRPPYVVHVVPSDRDHGVTALIVIIDRDDEPDNAVAVLHRLYRLTHAEAHVALHVARGEDLKDIAGGLSVSLTTVRTHLQHVFDKTGTHRQAELAHLLRDLDS